MPTPPNLNPISQLYLSDTFYTWYKKTNDLVLAVNPIEVYGITANIDHGFDGITLSDDNLGQWNIGYVMPAIIPNGHTFSGQIHFGNGVSGPIVNTFNGLTGSVIGIQSIDGGVYGSGPDYGHGLDLYPDAFGNVASIPVLINGVTGSTLGVLDLDASDIPNTIASITGPAGYVITSMGGSGGTMSWTSALFIGGASGAQEGLRVDAANERVVIAGQSVHSEYKLKIMGGNDGSIKMYGAGASANDIAFDNAGSMKADNSLYLMSGSETGNKISFLAGVTGATYGACTELMKLQYGPGSGNDNATLMIGSDSLSRNSIRTAGDHSGGYHDLSMADRGSIHADSGIHFSSPSESTNQEGDSALFHFGQGLNFNATETVFAIGPQGQIGVRDDATNGGIDYGISNLQIQHVLHSGGPNNKASWREIDIPLVGFSDICQHMTESGPFDRDFRNGTIITSTVDRPVHLTAEYYMFGSVSYHTIYVKPVGYGSYQLAAYRHSNGDTRHNMHRANFSWMVPAFASYYSGNSGLSNVIAQW